MPMGTPKFFEIIKDPYTNESELFILILMARHGVSTPLPVPNSTVAASPIYVVDPSNNLFAASEAATSSSLGNDTTAYPYALSGTTSFRFKSSLIVPPNWTMFNHYVAFGLIGSLEDLRGYI